MLQDEDCVGTFSIQLGPLSLLNNEGFLQAQSLLILFVAHRCDEPDMSKPRSMGTLARVARVDLPSSASSIAVFRRRDRQLRNRKKTTVAKKNTA